MTCLFCNIVSGELKSTIIYEDEDIIAFNDISPQAPVHKIIIPRKHIARLNEADGEENSLLLGRMMQTGIHLAKQLNIAEDGYRLVMNCNGQGGQTVFHVHLHLLGGRQMVWPPG